jgi:hypothetical protein
MGKPFSDDSLYLPLPLVPSVYLVIDLQTDRKKFAGSLGGGAPSALVPTTPRLDAAALSSPALSSSASTLPVSFSTLALPHRDTRQLSATLPTPASPMFPALLPPSPLLSPLHALPPLSGIGSLSIVHTPHAATPSTGSISMHNRYSNVRGVGFFLLVTAVRMHPVPNPANCCFPPCFHRVLMGFLSEYVVTCLISLCAPRMCAPRRPITTHTCLQRHPIRC